MLLNQGSAAKSFPQDLDDVSLVGIECNRERLTIRAIPSGEDSFSDNLAFVQHKHGWTYCPTSAHRLALRQSAFSHKATSPMSSGLAVRESLPPLADSIAAQVLRSRLREGRNRPEQ